MATGPEALRTTLPRNLRTLPDGRLLYGVVPLRDDESMRPSPPMRLCAMNASGTVSLTCRDLFIGPDRYMKIITREQIGEIVAIIGDSLEALAAELDLPAEG